MRYNYVLFSTLALSDKKLFSTSLALSAKKLSKKEPVLALIPLSKKDEVVKVPGINIPILTLIEKELNDLRFYKNTDFFELKSFVLLGLIDKALDEFIKVNKKGYINDTDLLNYPVIKEYIRLLLSEEAKKELKKDKVDKSFGLGDVSMGDLKLSYKDVKSLYK